MFFSLYVISAFMLFYLEGTVGQKKCLDCVPFTYCMTANYLAETDKSESTQNMFQKSYCGIYNNTIVKVCCSDFDTPELNTRWSNPEHPNKKLLPDSCGKISHNRILGGVAASLYEFPWMVVIAYGDQQNFGCSGTLINERYVLTAAHCVINKDIRGVRVGDYNLKQAVDCQGNVCETMVQDREVNATTVHDDFELEKFTNDIALIRLTVPVTLPLKNADTICLPTTKDMQKMSISHKISTVAGWGLTENGTLSTILRKVDLPVHPYSFCQDYYSHISGPNSSQLCAGADNKDSCRGDSGGPLMIETMINGKIKYVQYGIISSGPYRCGSDSPGIYTDVRKYTNWILDNIKP